MKDSKNLRLKYSSMVALLMASAMFTTCTNDELVTEPQQTPTTEKTYTLTVNATKGGEEVGTRALSLDGTTLNAAWTEGETVTVYNVTRSIELSGTLMAQSSGTSTTLEGSLTGTIENGDKLKLKFRSPDYDTQAGTLEYIAANCDYAEAEVDVSDASTPSVTTTAATFINQQAIVKFTLRDKADNSALNASSLTVNEGINSYTVTPTSATDVVYVAIPGFSNQTVTLTANVGNNYYMYSNPSVTFANSQYYAISVKMPKSYVNLGLPSGTLWATCNVGANSPEEYGDYFAWGETVPKEEYNWSTYKYCAGASSSRLTKYCTMSVYGNYGFTDGLTELQPEDDAATAYLGNGWQTPSREQCTELITNSNTTTIWTTQNDVNGRLFTSKINGESIFLPAAGRYGDTSLEDADRCGHYWSRTNFMDEYSSSSPGAGYLLFSQYQFLSGTGGVRYYGSTIRPVRKQ